MCGKLRGKYGTSHKLHCQASPIPNSVDMSFTVVLDEVLQVLLKLCWPCALVHASSQSPCGRVVCGSPLLLHGRRATSRVACHMRNARRSRSMSCPTPLSSELIARCFWRLSAAMRQTSWHTCPRCAHLPCGFASPLWLLYIYCGGAPAFQSHHRSAAPGSPTLRDG